MSKGVYDDLEKIKAASHSTEPRSSELAPPTHTLTHTHTCTCRFAMYFLSLTPEGGFHEVQASARLRPLPYPRVYARVSTLELLDDSFSLENEFREEWNQLSSPGVEIPYSAVLTEGPLGTHPGRVWRVPGEEEWGRF